MSESNKNTCPHCGKSVDSLRAPAVSVVDGKLAYFCSARCRNLCAASQNPSEEDSFVGKEPSAGAGKEPSAGAGKKPSAGKEPSVESGSAKLPTVSQSSKSLLKPTEENTQKPRKRKKHISDGSSAILIRSQLIMTFLVLTLTLAALFVPLILNEKLPVLVVGAGALVLMGWGVFKERRSGPSRMVEAAATPLAAGAILASSFFGVSPRLSALAAAALLLLEQLGRLAELFGRRHSGVLSVVEGGGPGAFSSSSWRDNSSLALKILRVAFVLEWARFILAAAIGGTVYVAYSNSLANGLLAFAMALVALNPRALRLITGDAHLSTALQMHEKSVTVRDAHVVDRIAASRIVVFMSGRCLTQESVSVVDWQTSKDGHVDESKLIRAVGSLEAGFEGRIAKAIKSFVNDRRETITQAGEVEFRPGLGGLGNTAFGHVICGARQLLMEEGVSVSLFEEQAQIIERSGRRALFVALEGKAEAVFGIEEQPVKGAAQAITLLSGMGLDPMMMTSAEVDPAIALGARLGIDNVRFETSEDQVATVLNQVDQLGERAVLVGHGARFEENVQSAAAAVSFGANQESQAGINTRGHEISIIPWIMQVSQRANRSVMINLVTTLAAMFVGLAFAGGWYSPFTVVVAAGVMFAASAWSTFNGPYPTFERWRNKAGRVIRTIRKQIARLPAQ